MSRLHTRLATGVATAVAVVAAGALVAPSAHAAPRPPILKEWANPGVVKDGSRYVMTHTTAWNAGGAFATAKKPNGPWRKHTKKRLLTKTPAWAKAPQGVKQKRGVWAPSIIKATNGTWVVFYSALVPGRGTSRCIGTGTAAGPTGPFVPDPQPISCFTGSGTTPQDLIANEGSSSLIDATPAVVNGQTVLTYKTSHRYARNGKKLWHTTIRMVALNPAAPNRIAPNPVHANGRSVRLTSARHKYIEENPSLVHRGGKYTLFTSWGWYGTHDQYWTRYRQNTSLWTGWGSKAVRTPTRLSFPKGTNTRGWGNAQAAPGLKGWVLFWNGQEPPKQFTRGEGPKYLYVGTLGWKGGKPYVRKVLKRG